MADKKFKVCLDTNVIRDYMTRRNRRSVYLLEHLKDSKITVVASFYCLMEFSDTNKDDIYLYRCLIKEKKTYFEFISSRNQKTLSLQDLKENSEQVLDVIKSLKYIQWLNLDKNAMETMLITSMETNIAAPDVIHLTTAYLAECSHLITNDGSFLKHAKKFLKKEEETDLNVVNVDQAIKEIWSDEA